MAEQAILVSEYLPAAQADSSQWFFIRHARQAGVEGGYVFYVGVFEFYLVEDFAHHRIEALAVLIQRNLVFQEILVLSIESRNDWVGSASIESMTFAAEQGLLATAQGIVGAKRLVRNQADKN